MLPYRPGRFPADMAVNRNHFIGAREREAVILLTALRFLEAHALLGAAELRDAKQRLQLLLLSAGSGISMLPHLREQLDAAHRLHQSLARISDILTGARQCGAVLHQRQAQLASRIAQAPDRTAATQEFIVRLFAFSREFIGQCNVFADALARYVAAREREARMRRAQKIRLVAHPPHATGGAGDPVQSDRAADAGVRNNAVVFPFGTEQTESGLAAEVSLCADRVESALRAIAPMSAAATSPARRAPWVTIPDDADIYRIFFETMERHACVRSVADRVTELFALYENAHPMLQRDYQKLKEPLETMERNTDAYVRETAANADVAARRDRLHKIAALIAFLDDGARLAVNDDLYAYPTFSRELSAAIREPRAAWQPIAGDLLRAKIHA
ncbi:MAG: hypothetical protein ACJ8KO_00670, partial [Sulfurifustaceae bacterium]